MGSDVSVVLQADAPVPDVVIRTQRAAPSTVPSPNARAVVQHCPAIRVVEAGAARKIAGDSSAASMMSTADLSPLDQPILLIRNCAELDAFTKSRTYAPVLRSIYAYLDQHEPQAAAAALNGKRGAGMSSLDGAVRRPVCPIGLILDPSLAIGGRLSSNEARAACAQCLKLFLVHLVAALEFVRKPDDAAPTKWPSSPEVQALREASAGATPGALPPRLSILYLDLRRCALDDEAARWFATTVILRAVRRARPFMLVSARGGVVGVTAAMSGSNGSGNTFLNYYSPDVKADMVWASLQHLLLTDNDRLTQEGAKAVLAELLAEDATRKVLLRQQGMDTTAQRAREVTQALAGGRLSPRPDSQLLPQLYLVDILREPLSSANIEKDAVATQDEVEEKPATPGRAGGLAPSHLTGTTSEAIIGGEREEGVPDAASSVPPSPHNEPPQPTARSASPKSAPSPKSSQTPAPAAAAKPTPSTEASRSQQELNQNTAHAPSAPLERRPPQQQAAATHKETPAPRQELQNALAQLPTQQQLRRRPPPPQHRQPPRRNVPPLQRTYLKAATLSANGEEPEEAHEHKAVPSLTLAAPWESNPVPSRSPGRHTPSPPRNSTYWAEAMADSPAALPQLQRSTTTPPATPPRAAQMEHRPSSATSPVRRELEPTRTPAEVQGSLQPPPSSPSPAAAAFPAAPVQKAEGLTKPTAARGVRKPTPQRSPRQPPKSANRPPFDVAPSTAALVDTAPVLSAQRRRRSSCDVPSEQEKYSNGAAGHSGQVKPPAAAAAEAAGKPSSHALVAAGKGADQENVSPLPQQRQHQQQQRVEPPRSKRSLSASKKKAPPPQATAGASTPAPQHNEGEEEQKQPPLDPSVNPTCAASTPPTLSHSGCKGQLRAPASRQQQPPLPSPRNPSPSNKRRLQQAIAHAAELDDVPDVVVNGHSARRPGAQSPRPGVRCRTPSLPASARKPSGAGEDGDKAAAAEEEEITASLPVPPRHRSFRSPVRLDHTELEAAQSAREWVRSRDPSMADRAPSSRVSRNGASARPLVVSPCRLRPPPPDRDADEVQEELGGEEKVVELPVDFNGRTTYNGAPRREHDCSTEHRNATASSRSARAQRPVDVPPLDLPRPPVVAARRRGPPPQQHQQRRGEEGTSSAPATHGRPRTPRGSSKYGAACAHADLLRGRDSVSAAKAAYEAATLAEARAKVQAERRAKRKQQQQQQQRQRHLLRQENAAADRSASLQVEGEVNSVHEEGRPSRPARRGSSPSPAPNRPSGARAPSPLHAPPPPAQRHAPRSAQRRLSTAAPPHIEPRLTTTSQLRRVTSQRYRRASEVEAGIHGFYALNATPRLDFRGETAVASMAQRQPTRDELAAVQMEKEMEKGRRSSFCDSRRASAAAGVNGYEEQEPHANSHDVSNPLLKAQPRTPSRTTSLKTAQASPQQPKPQPSQGTPAYQANGRGAQVNGDAVDSESGNDEETSTAPSLSPWGTADYQGSAPRQEEEKREDGVTVEVSAYGVELVNKALRTPHRTLY
ncbi:hypothetical protein ABB37_08450 [Leptomonas pyrrhocoris]|uniref:Uncharacterized protein n=1 Tax=Leptomonas pyrrhocoris TaxID=157538 RepID=A0A0M9FTI5_LEPPY|nr:hypothetical protein ABB37_08450 [Leptomonas pyrrhocoris]KPA75566.1 hypothetical protein ABB37_08450 [Leptomonas pyrrhocoris]|eukprot:XP_015654005.1 hypothetical protein ABB37_08450 [Leptomonas pyrrhocoris]